MVRNVFRIYVYHNIILIYIHIFNNYTENITNILLISIFTCMLLISLVIFIIGYELSYLHDPLCVVLALCDMVNISKYKQYSSLIDGCSRAWGGGRGKRIANYAQNWTNSLKWATQRRKQNSLFRVSVFHFRIIYF